MNDPNDKGTDSGQQQQHDADEATEWEEFHTDGASSAYGDASAFQSNASTERVTNTTAAAGAAAPAAAAEPSAPPVEVEDEPPPGFAAPPEGVDGVDADAVNVRRVVGLGEDGPPPVLTVPTGEMSDAHLMDDYALALSVANNGDANEIPNSRGTSATYTEDGYFASATSADESERMDPNANALPPGVSARDQQEDAMMRLLAAQLSRRDWAASDTSSPALERRIRDFKFAQQKRREKYGNERPWGILGLYDHLAAIRLDLEWAEDAAWRRENKEPYLSWADFEDSRDTGFNRPFFTYFILVVCTIMLIVSIGVNDWSIEPLNVNPMIGPSAETLLKLGAKQTSLIVNHGEWFRLFSPMVLHAGVIHYLLNMLALWFIGGAVEKSHGFVAAAIIFIIPATGGTILSAIFLPEYISVGASGGIFGLIGACVADIAMNWSLLFSKQVNQNDEGTRFRHIKVLLWLLFDIILNCLIGLTPFVDNFTHLGGMVYGFLCGLSTMEKLSMDFFGVQTDFCSRTRSIFVRFFGLILSVVLIMVSTALLVESDGTTSPCSNCRYVSCVPFPPWEAQDDKWWYCDDCPFVSADAQKDQNTGYFEELTLTCPDGAIEDIDLSGEEITDREWVRKQLPTYCRDHCSNIFKSRDD